MTLVLCILLSEISSVAATPVMLSASSNGMVIHGSVVVDADELSTLGFPVSRDGEPLTGDAVVLEYDDVIHSPIYGPMSLSGGVKGLLGFDTNADGHLNGEDGPHMRGALSLHVDDNHDGRIQPDELETFTDAAISVTRFESIQYRGDWTAGPPVSPRLDWSRNGTDIPWYRYGRDVFDIRDRRIHTIEVLKQMKDKRAVRRYQLAHIGAYSGIACIAGGAIWLSVAVAIDAGRQGPGAVGALALLPVIVPAAITTDIATGIPTAFVWWWVMQNLNDLPHPAFPYTQVALNTWKLGAGKDLEALTWDADLTIPALVMAGGAALTIVSAPMVAVVSKIPKRIDNSAIDTAIGARNATLKVAMIPTLEGGMAVVQVRR